MSKIKDVLLCLLLAVAIWPTIEIGLIAHQARERAPQIIDNLDAAAFQIRLTGVDAHQAVINVRDGAGEFKAASTAVQAGAAAWVKLVTDPAVLRSIGLAARTGDDLARFVFKVNNIADDVRLGTIPRVNTVLDSTNVTVLSARDALIVLKSLLADSDATATDLRTLLHSPDATRALKAIVGALVNTQAITADTKISVSDIREALPEFVALLKDFMQSANGSGKNIEQITSELTQKPSRKKQVLMFLASTIIGNARSLIGR